MRNAQVQSNMMLRGEALAESYVNGNSTIAIAEASVCPALTAATMMNLPAKLQGEFARKVIENDITR